MTPDPITYRLRLARIARGLTTRATADLLGCSPAAVTQWEMGHRNPPLSRIRQYADLFGYDLELTRRDGGA